jgi:GTP-binding protein
VIGFVDETVLEVSSGKGGDGAVSFRREKYIRRGGPDGGDGGKGGDVVFVAEEGLKGLGQLRRVYRAGDGARGQKKRLSGKAGADAVIGVPPGTQVLDAGTGALLKDLNEGGQKWTCLDGGAGGKGNWHFASSTRQAPRFALPGREGQTRRFRVELASRTDVGLVGRPNSGKSTLLSLLTNATPRIEPYPFTTTKPNFGVLSCFDVNIVIADLPAIIDGSSRGAGLGLRFLRHIRRSQLLLLLVDLSDPLFLCQADSLRDEMARFSKALLEKECFVLGMKTDVEGAEAALTTLTDHFRKHRVLGVSSKTGQGIEQLKADIHRIFQPRRTAARSRIGD